MASTSALPPDAHEAPDAPDATMMLCGKHVRPENISEMPGRREWEAAERYHRDLLPGEKQGSCLCDYYDYPQLLHERMHVSPDVETPKKPFPLFKLPAELRNRVYEFAVTTDEAIEFSPEPFFYNGVGNSPCTKADWHDDLERTKAHHRESMKRAAGSAALLRVNKQLYSEVLPVFYGENEFRFSNVSGWIGLDFFLHKIGLDKCSMLRKVTICHPKCLHIPTSLKQGSDLCKGSPFLECGVIKEPGFTYKTRWFDEEISTDPILVLQKAGKLQQLRLVSPANTHTTFDYNPFDITCFKDLKVTMVSLRSDKLMPAMARVDLPWAHKDAEAAKNIAERHFEETGEKWDFLDTVIDEYGRY